MRKKHRINSSKILRRNLFIFFSMALLVFSILQSVSLILPMYSRLKEAENKNLLHSAEMKATAISEWGRRAHDIAFQITSRTRIRQELERFNKGEIALSKIKSFTTPKLADAMNLSDEIIGITRLDRNDRVIAECGMSIEKNDWPEFEFTNKNIIASAPIKILNGFGIVIGARIANRANEHVGIDLVLMDMKYLKAIINDYSGLTKKSEIILAYLSNKKIRSVFPFQNKIDPTQKAPPLSSNTKSVLKKAIIGGKGLEHSGNTVIAYYPIKDWSWGLYVSQHKDELYSSLKVMLVTIILGLFAILVLCLFVFWFMIKPLSTSILLNTEELETIVQKKTELLETEIIGHIQAEAQIRANLKEKETLLQEIHHRVKNNMNVVSSLLKLHGNSVKSDECKSVLKESQGRIYAMSAVHEALYNSENLAEINVQNYLTSIVGTLVQTYSTKPGTVLFNIDGDSVSLCIDKASPLGLIVNELITNSLKYAFPENRHGVINVNVKNLEREFELVVMDNGIGFPNNLDWKSSSTLGLKLVRTLVENQLDGSIDMENNNGTKFTIKFNIETWNQTVLTSKKPG